MTIKYIPAPKDKDENVFVGLMGFYDDYLEAQTKLYCDFIFWIPLGLLTHGVVEYDEDAGLPNIHCEINTPGYGMYKCSIISGPKFEEWQHED